MIYPRKISLTSGLSRDWESPRAVFTRRFIGAFLLWNMNPGHSRPHWKRSGLVGASCFLYMLPAFSYYDLSARYEDAVGSWLTFILSMCFVAVTCVSFLADYVHIPTLSTSEVEDWYNCTERHTKYPPSQWGKRDRVVSLAVAAFASLEGYLRIGLLPSLCMVLVCFVCILISRGARSSSSWVYRHSFWHLTSSTVLFLLASI